MIDQIRPHRGAIGGIAIVVLSLGCAARSEPDAPLDRASAVRYAFLCDGGEVVSFRFLGPDVIELDTEAGRYILRQERTASGARYLDEDVSFWQKGDEAMLGRGGETVRCAAETP